MRRSLIAAAVAAVIAAALAPLAFQYVRVGAPLGAFPRSVDGLRLAEGPWRSNSEFSPNVFAGTYKGGDDTVFHSIQVNQTAEEPAEEVRRTSRRRTNVGDSVTAIGDGIAYQQDDESAVVYWASGTWTCLVMAPTLERAEAFANRLSYGPDPAARPSKLWWLWSAPAVSLVSFVAVFGVVFLSTKLAKRHDAHSTSGKSNG
jgi:hypothetical protein